MNAKVGTSFVGKIDHNYRTTNLDKYKEIWTEGLTNAGYDGEDGMTSAEWLNAYVMDWYNVDLTQNIKSVDWLKEILQNGFHKNMISVLKAGMKICAIILVEDIFRIQVSSSELE